LKGIANGSAAWIRKFQVYWAGDRYFRSRFYKIFERMSEKFKEYQQLNLTAVHKEIIEFWKENKIFERSVEERKGAPEFVFYEGPPSANGMPGIHHVMARTIKDLFCRYKTQRGYEVIRKAGWDTHGLPIELSVEKTLGITKEDIGKKISIEEYNAACRREVMKYTDAWNELTELIGYWVDLKNPYITYETAYIESVWWLLKKIYDKGLLYKGYTIQPYSPKAGTGLSSHELNQPGCYRNIKDTSVVAIFQLRDQPSNREIFARAFGTEFLPGDGILAWTTTPWTLPSNTALTVGPAIQYALIETFNPYTHQPQRVIQASDLIEKNFGKQFIQVFTSEEIGTYSGDPKAKIPYRIISTCTGEALCGLQYHQLLPYALPYKDAEKAFVVISGDFVTTEDGTGIVHTAPTFGADDAKVAADWGVPPMLVPDRDGRPVPLVDLQGRFTHHVSDPQFGFAGEYVKTEYYTDEELKAEYEKQKIRLKPIIPELKHYLSVDERIALKLKMEGHAFKIEKYEHSYPHCWRTDKPVLYYPLDSWFINVRAVKDRLVENNRRIRWKPQSTGTGRFANWLENINDWNLSRSRFWGIPLPIWRTEDGSEEKCIGSLAELKAEIERSVALGNMTHNPLKDFNPEDTSKQNYEKFDLHKPYIDGIVLTSSDGRPMYRENDLIDVWFDSGAMPFAQYHYPFATGENLSALPYPADFIAEGVDQTRGWFYTLHAISTLVYDTIAYKTVISNGLVLDKNGQKMSKRLGNAIDPFDTIEKYGSDTLRWYMITNAQPWDNLKFDFEGLVEVQRKFFSTLHNTYSFFALYANVDGFKCTESPVPMAQRTELDLWILSELHTLIKRCTEWFDDYEPTQAGRAIQYFVTEDLSNWYVRLSRRRFWKGEYNADKIAAYQTLYECLLTISKLMAPIAPFYAEQLYRNLVITTGTEPHPSVHLAPWPKADESLINPELEAQTHLAQQICSMILSLRKRQKIRVRQPLQKVMIPALQQQLAERIARVADLIKSEVNVKEIEILTKDQGKIVKRAKPDFKKLGARLGKAMKEAAQAIASLSPSQIEMLETNGSITLQLSSGPETITADEVEIFADNIPGWLVAVEKGLTVALDITITPDLYREGLARDLINRVQNLRKEHGLQVTDRIHLYLQPHPDLQEAVTHQSDYIRGEILANEITFTDLAEGDLLEFDDFTALSRIEKI
jgi:isoleucyl-tRNA synthetase